MNITVSDKTAAQVEKWISDGDYPDEASALEAAVDLLNDLRERERLIKSIRESDRSIDDGYGVPLDEIDLEIIHAQARTRIDQGLEPDPDVMPR